MPFVQDAAALLKLVKRCFTFGMMLAARSEPQTIVEALLSPQLLVACSVIKESGRTSFRARGRDGADFHWKL